MRFLILVITLVLFGSSVEAQEKRAMFPYSVFNQKPLTVGAAVWVNVGDTQCAYGRWSVDPWPSQGLMYPLPSASDPCFREYRKARIVEITRQQGSFWYKVRIEGMDPQPNYRSFYAEFWRLYEIFNLPEDSEWRKHSKYFLALNW